MEGTMHTLPESAFDYLCELWCRSHDRELVSIKKIPPGTLTEADLEGVEIMGREDKAS